MINQALVIQNVSILVFLLILYHKRTATGNGSFDQGNSAILDHTVDQQNRCDQSGSNGAFCSNTASSFDTDFVLPITQTNNASGDGSLWAG